MYGTGTNGRGRREKDNENKGDGGNSVGEEMEGADLEGTATINIALFLRILPPYLHRSANRHSTKFQSHFITSV